MVTTFDSITPVKLVKRYSRAQQCTMQIPQPCLVSNYNAHMGGVDLMDKLLGVYCISIRGKKR